ncbi:hypothetical protein SLS62_001555 [Diatrype stigma]|uniref:Digeranylgeranylglyceryl phosphate synthase n=1 Tax=Diatrype stigma TaxID=117547 RepID=A0AAN9V851_9PEZI
MSASESAPPTRLGRPPTRMSIGNIISVLWGFTESDLVTFAFPNTAFGILGALAGTFAAADNESGVVPRPPTWREIVLRLPLVLAFNWCNLLVFNMANQRSALSVAEDAVNKPWRPISSGKITPEQTRRAMLAIIPLSLWYHHLLGLWAYGLGMLAGIWAYNDLGGGDEAFLRELLIALGYGVFNHGSLRIALGSHGAEVGPKGNLWTAIISGVVLTTMQVQDLKDQAGDRLRGRKTIVLFLGERFSRGSIAFFVCVWSCVCAWFWAPPVWAGALMVALGGLVVWRVLMQRGGVADDRRTWRTWCFWHSCLYLLPFVDFGRAAFGTPPSTLIT